MKEEFKIPDRSINHEHASNSSNSLYFCQNESQNDKASYEAIHPDYRSKTLKMANKDIAAGSTPVF